MFDSKLVSNLLVLIIIFCVELCLKNFTRNRRTETYPDCLRNIRLTESFSNDSKNLILHVCCIFDVKIAQIYVKHLTSRVSHSHLAYGESKRV